MTTPASSLALRLDGVSKSFRRETGESVLALDNISFSVNPGGLYALVGPDGAGKTTLIRLLTGLMKADHGTVTVLGIDAAKEPQAIQSRISYMPQRFGLYDDLTVLENLDLYADMHGIPADTKRAQYASLMEMTGLGPFQKRLAGKLSGGMKQKLGLACTLVRSPQLLLLDEPTVGVDPLSRQELWEIVRRLVKGGMTVLISSSFLDEAEACERVLVLNNGKKLAEGPPGEVSGLASGRTYLLSPPGGTKLRDFQARLLAEPDVIDAVPESGQVRLVSRAATGRTGSVAFGGVVARLTPARFEDGFMVLLQQSGAANPSRSEASQPEEPLAGSRDDSMVEVRDHVFDLRRHGRRAPSGATIDI